MTDPRAAFEEWAATYGYETIADAEGLYWNDATQMAWLSWQAAIKAEREACARVAETVPLESFCSVPSMAMLAKNRADVAAAIRSRSA